MSYSRFSFPRRAGAVGNSIPYVVVIAVVNITALVVANIQAYRARNVRTEFNESSYIAMANVSFLQAIFICVPILFLTRENPQVRDCLSFVHTLLGERQTHRILFHY